MILRTLTTAALAVTAGAIHAQDLALEEVEAGDAMVEELGMTVDQLDGMTVRDAAGETVGEVDDVLARPDGVITSVSVAAGGFLGIGEKEVVMPLNSLEPGSDGLVTTMTEAEIGVLPELDE